MRAIVQTKYGSADELELREVETPSPAANQVLVKVQAVAINDYDWCMVSGKPLVYRLMFGLFKPTTPIPGMEIAGEVVECGVNVKKFKVGDAVFGDLSEHGFGGFAEYVSVDENALFLKPSQMKYEDAAAISHAACLALQGLVDVGNLACGEKVLINGAGGGVGAYGLNIAKLYDANVTAVDAAHKLATLKQNGFDEALDYQRIDFTRQSARYDLILDTKTNRGIFRYLKVLAPNGRYVTVGGDVMRLIQLLLLKPWIALFTNKRVSIVALKTNKDLATICEWYLAKKLVPVLELREGLSAVPQAISYFGAGKHKGKLVVRLK